jgi:hypothetical protein
MAKPRKIDTPRGWLAANGVDLAPLTGQDARALDAIAGCWELYAAADEQGAAAALLAVRDLLLAMQPQCRNLTKKLIARALDWGDVDRLWRKVTFGYVYVGDPSDIEAGIVHAMRARCLEPIKGSLCMLAKAHDGPCDPDPVVQLRRLDS